MQATSSKLFICESKELIKQLNLALNVKYLDLTEDKSWFEILNKFDRYNHKHDLLHNSISQKLDDLEMSEKIPLAEKEMLDTFREHNR